MLTRSLLVILTGLLAAIEAREGHPTNYDYCTPGLTRPKQPKPPGWQPPKKPVGVDFPPGKPAPLPLSAGGPQWKAPVSPPTKQPPQVVQPKPKVSGLTPPKSENKPKTKPVPPQHSGLSHPQPKKHSSKHQHKHHPPKTLSQPCDKNKQPKPQPGGHP